MGQRTVDSLHLGEVLMQLHAPITVHVELVHDSVELRRAERQPHLAQRLDQLHRLDIARAVHVKRGRQALDALADAQVETDPSLFLRAATLYLPIENYAFQAMFLMGVFERQAYNYDPDANLDQFNVPELKTEMDWLGVGPIQILSVPGELLPELAVGGYDGSHTNIGNYEDPIFDPEQANPPNLAAAPEGPYLKDRMGGTHNWILGLGNDELGYIIPEYNFVLDGAVAYLREAEGDHYEETAGSFAGF